MNIPAPSGGNWFWRWGMLAATGGGVVAAARLYEIWLSTSGAAGQAMDMAICATAFSATLLFCWIISRRSVSTPAEAAHPTDALLATVVVSTALAVAAARLDGPISLDEHEVLFRYGIMPLGEIASTYDDPNNHVLHTLAVGVARGIGGWSLPVLRLPAFASFCLLLPAVWWFARKEFGPTAATFATAFVGTTPLLVDYAAQARGYTLLLLMFMAMLLCGRALVRQPDRTALWAAWAAAAALGFYTVPLMAFPALTAATWMLLARWREGGRAAMRPFAVKTAAWSLAALAGVALLYAPVLAAEGIQGMRQAFNVSAGQYRFPASPPLHLQLFEVWRAWFFRFPVYAWGVLFALVVAGAAVPGRRSRLGVGALLLAAGLATGLLLAAEPFIPKPRLVLWMLPLFMTAAGVGAAFVLEQAVAWAGARWPRIAAGAGRRTAVAGATVLVASVLTSWAAQPSSYNLPRSSQTYHLRAMVSSTAPLMESGDHFTTFNLWARMAMLEMREHMWADSDTGYWLPPGSSTAWSIYQVAGAGESPESRMPARVPSNNKVLTGGGGGRKEALRILSKRATRHAAEVSQRVRGGPSVEPRASCCLQRRVRLHAEQLG